jgi:hypothetical protein
MPGKSYIKTGTYNWSKIKKMYLKTGATTWTAVRKAYLKTGAATWKKVFDTSSNRPFIENNDYPKIRLNTYRSTSTSGVQPPVNAAPIQFIGPRSNGSKGTATPSPTDGYVGDDGIGGFLWGYDGDWEPETGVNFTYDWFWANTPDANDATASYTPATPSGADDKISNVNANLGWLVNNEPNGVWLYFRVNASNASGTARAISTPVRLVRQEPTASTWSMLSPSSSSLNTPKYVSTSISNLWYDAPHFYESKVEWFSESSNTSPSLNSSTLVKTETLASFASSRTEIDGTTITQQPSYMPVSVNSLGYSDADKYIYAKLTLINSYTKSQNSPITYITKTTVPVGQVRTITPNWGDYISVSTNGYIGIGAVGGMTSIQDTGTTGHVASILSKDLDQIHLKYYSDSSKYIVDYAGKLHGDSGTSITYRYQAWFYPGQNYVDFHVILNAGGTSGNAYLYNGEQQVPWGASKPSTTAYRVTLTSGVAYQNITYAPRSTATGFTNVTTNDGADDAFTLLQLVQGVSAPENSAFPQFQLISGNSNKVGSTYRLSSGSWLNSPTQYNYYIVKNDINGTTLANSGWTTNTYYDYTFTATSTQTVSGFVIARNSGGESSNAYASSIGPIEADLTPPTPTGVTWNGSAFFVSFTGGSGPYYQLWYERGTEVTPPSISTGADSSGTLPASPGTISFPAPFTPAAGEQWNFWLRSATSPSASTAGVDKGAYSSNYVSVTIPGPSEFSISIYDSTVTPNTPSVSTSQSSNTINLDWADDANATGNYVSYVSGGSQGFRTNPRTVSYDFWSVTAGSSYSGGVYAINTTKSVTMSWGIVPGAQSYRVAYDVGGGTTQVVDKGGATSHTVYTSQAVRVLGIVAYSGSNYDGVSRSGNYDALLFVTPTNKTSGTGTWSYTYNPVTTYGACDVVNGTTYGSYYDDCSGQLYRQCRSTTTSYKRIIYIDGTNSGTYDTSGCTSTTSGTDCGTYSYTNGKCGYTLTCTASCGTYSAYGAYSAYTAYGPCYSTGSTAAKDRTRERCRTRTCTATDCSTYVETNCQVQVNTAACTVTRWICNNYDYSNSASANYQWCVQPGGGDCNARFDSSAGRTSCVFS